MPVIILPSQPQRPNPLRNLFALSTPKANRLASQFARREAMVCDALAGSVMDDNVGLQRAKEQLLKQQLKSSLKALPAPKNEYEIDFAAAVPEQVISSLLLLHS